MGSCSLMRGRTIERRSGVDRGSVEMAGGEAADFAARDVAEYEAPAPAPRGPEGDKFLRRETAPERKRRSERDATALFEGGSARAGGAVGLAAVAPGLRPIGDFSAVL